MDIKKVSQAVRAKVKEIITMEDNQNNITEKEYEELGKLLNGDGKSRGLSGKDEREYVEGFMIEHENGTKNNAISKSAKDFVKQVKKMLGDKKAIDNDVEVGALLSELNKNNFGKEDKAYIIRELRNAGYEVGVYPVFDEISTEIILPEEVEDKHEPEEADNTTDIDVPESETDKKTDETTVKDEPEPKETDTPKEETKPEKGEPGPTKPLPEEGPKGPKNETPLPEQGPKGPANEKPVDEPDAGESAPKANPHIDIPDAEYGERLGEKMNKELYDSKIWVSDAVVTQLLDKVDEKNAYNFFKELELDEKVNKGQQYPFKDIMNNSDGRSLVEMSRPLKALLAQAKEFGLEGNDAYNELQKIVNDMQGSVNFDNQDTSYNKKMDVDAAIINLIQAMDAALRRTDNAV